jgi:hypothetical protein
MNNYLPNNPVFESLRESARNFKPLNEFNIHEQGEVGSGIDAKEVQEYYKMIQDQIVTQVSNWALLFPFRATMLTIVKNLKPELDKQGKSATLKDTVDSFKLMWKSIGTTAATDKDFQLISNVYDKANEGFNKLILAYEALRKLGGAKLDDPALVKYSNELLIANVAQFNATIKGIEQELSSVAASAKK